MRACTDITNRAQLEASVHAREALVALLQSLGDATLERPHPWEGWDGTLADYVRSAIIDHEAEHREALARAWERLGTSETGQQWETCEIVWILGGPRRDRHALAYFCAVATDQWGPYVTEQGAHGFSDINWWPDGRTFVSETKRSQRALRELVARLELQGWEADGQGRAWYSRRFRCLPDEPWRDPWCP